MTDLDRRHLRGPVHTMRTETAEWDAATESWKSPPGFEFVIFRPDGMASGIESHYVTQTSYATNLYDAGGRLTEIEWWVDAGPKTRTQFRYDARGRPAESFLVNRDGTRQQPEAIRARPPDTTGDAAGQCAVPIQGDGEGDQASGTDADGLGS